MKKTAKEFTDQFQKDYDEGEGQSEEYDFSYGNNEGGLLSKT